MMDVLELALEKEKVKDAIEIIGA